MRAFTPADAGPLHRLLSHEGVLRYFPPAPPPDHESVERMIARIIQHWADNDCGLWALERRTDGALLGRSGLQHFDDSGEIEVDFILGRPYWNRGYASEAGRAALRFGFEELGCAYIVGIVHVDNIASQRVLEKIGMHREVRASYFGLDCFRYRIERQWTAPEDSS